MLRHILISIPILLLILIIILVWKVYHAGRPIQKDEISNWVVEPVDQGHWSLSSVTENHRRTDAWIEGPKNDLSCDTLIMIAGVAEGSDFLKIEKSATKRANTMLMRQPLKDFAKPETFESWGLLDWWNLPEKARHEFIQNVAALSALIDYIRMQSKTLNSIFTGKIVLAGGSLGAPIPSILTSFYPDKISGLMIIYGFTNYVELIRNEIYRQGLIHFGISKTEASIIEKIKRAGLQITARLISWFLGNMLKYGQIELYLPDIRDTPIHFINGKNDHLITEEIYRPMWEAAPEPKTELWLEGGHIDPGKNDDVKRIIRLMDEWSSSQNLRECIK